MSNKDECFWCEGTGIEPGISPKDGGERCFCIMCEGKGVLEPLIPNYEYKGDWFE